MLSTLGKAPNHASIGAELRLHRSQSAVRACAPAGGEFLQYQSRFAITGKKQTHTTADGGGKQHCHSSQEL